MSAGSGLSVTDDAVETYKNLQQKHQHSYIIFKCSDDNTQIEVEKVGEKHASWDDMMKDIPDNDSRYAVYDCPFDTAEGGHREKVVFVTWNPDTAKIKQKMVYAASKDALKKKLVGIAHEQQCDCKADLNLDEIKCTLRSKTK